jgi:hypothetical protein
VEGSGFFVFLRRSYTILREASRNLDFNPGKMMTRYANRSGDSGVVGYEIGDEAIAVEFVGGDTYLYSYRSTGKKQVETMKKLARKGEGLSTFISREVRDRFEQKIDHR